MLSVRTLAEQNDNVGGTTLARERVTISLSSNTNVIQKTAWVNKNTRAFKHINMSSLPGFY